MVECDRCWQPYALLHLLSHRLFALLNVHLTFISSLTCRPSVDLAHSSAEGQHRNGSVSVRDFTGMVAHTPLDALASAQTPHARMHADLIRFLSLHFGPVEHKQFRPLKPVH